MIVNGKNFGHEIPLYAKRAVPSNGGGQKTRILLDDLPSEHGGMRLAVKGFTVILPLASFFIAIGMQLDGVSLAQLIGSLTIQLANDAPPTRYLGSTAFVDSIDGPTALNAFAFLSDKPIFTGAGGRLLSLVAQSLDATTATHQGTAKRQKRRGWLADTGPFGGGDANGATFSQAVAVYIPVGERYGEDDGNCAVPANWFNGRMGDGTQQGAGAIEITLGTSVDNQAVTWAGGGTFDVIAHCMKLPHGKSPVPLLPRIRRESGLQKVFRLAPGIRVLAALGKKLTPGGAMQSHSYSRVKVRCESHDVINDDLTAHMYNFQNDNGREDDFKYTLAEEVITNAAVGAARYSRPWLPLISHDGSTLQAPGSLTEPTLVEIDASGEAGAHDLVDVTLCPITQAVADAAERWVGVPGAKCYPSAKNGNLLGRAGVGQIVPNKVLYDAKGH